MYRAVLTMDSEVLGDIVDADDKMGDNGVYFLFFMLLISHRDVINQGGKIYCNHSLD